jgi:hypothetical protein
MQLSLLLCIVREKSKWWLFTIENEQIALELTRRKDAYMLLVLPWLV